MLEYLKHRKSLVSKGKKSTTPSSSSFSSFPLVPAVTVTTTVAPPLPHLASAERIKDYVHCFLTNFLSQSGIIGSDINPSFSAPPVVPDWAPPLWGVAGGLWADTLYRGRLTEPSGVVPPTSQEETPRPMCLCLCMLII